MEGGRWSKKNLVNVVCERPLMIFNPVANLLWAIECIKYVIL